MPRIEVGPDEPFTGAGVLRCDAGGLAGNAQKPFVRVQVGDTDAEAILDTGGVQLVLRPTTAMYAGIRGAGKLVHSGESVHLRGRSIEGDIYSHAVQLVAVTGSATEVEMSIFVPTTPEDDWDMPDFLGWQGCLERFRFALDAEAERFYFGVIGNGAQSG